LPDPELGRAVGAFVWVGVVSFTAAVDSVKVEVKQRAYPFAGIFDVRDGTRSVKRAYHEIT